MFTHIFLSFQSQKRRAWSPTRVTIRLILLVASLFVLQRSLLNRPFPSGDNADPRTTQLASSAACSSFVFVTAFIDLGPEHTEKTATSRVEHFRTLASSGIALFVFVSPSYMDLLEGLENEFPNIMRIEPLDMGSLKTVQTIRSFPNLRLPASLTSHKDTQGFLELMLAKIDFVHAAMSHTQATHLAWIDFNIAHVFTGDEPLQTLRNVQRRCLKQNAFAIAGIWDKGTSSDLDSLVKSVNWRFAGGFFIGDRASLTRWYELQADALVLFLDQTQTLVWEVNFWCWLEQTFPHTFRPLVYKSDHDNTLVDVPSEMSKE